MAYQPRSPSAVPDLRVRNQRTQALIRRDAIWQIAVPLGLAILIAVGLIVWLIVLLIVNAGVGVPAASVWADVSLIFLIIPTAVMALVAMALLFGAAYGLRLALRELPFFFKKAQDWVALAAYRVNTGAEKVANVVLASRSWWAGARKAARDVRDIFSREEV